MRILKKTIALILTVAAVCLAGFIAYEWYVGTEEVQNVQLNRLLSRYDDRLLLPSAFSYQNGRDDLDDEGKETYDAIVKCLYNHFANITLPISDKNEVHEIYLAVLCDYPDIFWDEGYSVRELGSGLQFSPVYLCTLEQRQEQSQKLDDAAQALADLASVFESEYDRALFVHDCIVANTVYDVTLAEPMVYDARGVLLNNLAVCAGYAKAFMLVMQKLDIECYYVTGTTLDGVGHAWNIAKLDGVYTVIDSTHDDPTIEGQSAEYISHAYFGISSEDAAKSRKTDRFGYSYPVCRDINYFSAKGLYIRSIKNEASAIAAELYRAIQNGSFSVQIRLSSSAAFMNSVSSYYPLGYVIEQTNKLLAANKSSIRLKGQFRYFSVDELNVLTLITEAK